MEQPNLPPARRDERPMPVLLHDGFVTPGAMCAELTAALRLLEAYIRGTPPPAACRAPRMSRSVLAVMAASQQAAVDYRRRETQRAHAAASVTPGKVLPPAQILPLSSQEELTTEMVAGILGVTSSRVRQLAASGRLPGRKAERDVWLFTPGDVRAYRAHPRRSTGDADTDPESERAPRRGAA